MGCFRRILARILLALLVATVLIAVTPRQPRASSTALLVPAYFYPEGAGLNAWKQLVIDASSINLEAVLNPASGPGTSQDPNYVAVVNKLRTAGGGVFGYVSTQYGNRDLASVEHDILTYNLYYNINGFFVDEMANTQKKLLYYDNIYRFIKQLNFDFKVVGNPGTPYTLESYLGAADTLVIFEGSSAAYADYKPFVSAPWVANYPRARFSNIVYGVENVAEMQQALAKAARTNTGAVHISDGELPNPYGGLPSYWARQVAAIQAQCLSASPEGAAITMRASRGGGDPDIKPGPSRGMTPPPALAGRLDTPEDETSPTERGASPCLESRDAATHAKRGVFDFQRDAGIKR
jgi:hypothetical protein